MQMHKGLKTAIAVGAGIGIGASVFVLSNGAFVAYVPVVPGFIKTTLALVAGAASGWFVFEKAKGK